MLRDLYPSTPIPPDQRRADVVIIPGVGTPGIEEWRDNVGSWLETLPGACHDQLQTLVYEYEVQLSTGVSVPQQLSQEGHKFLSALDKHVSSKKPARHSLFFICHSLGGIVLKKALNLLAASQHRHPHLLDVIAGLFFLGTPHSGFSEESNIVDLILRTTPRKLPAKNVLSPSGGDMDILVEISRQFRPDGNVGRIYSCYEDVPSKVYGEMFRRFLRRPRQVILVQPSICKIGTPGETLVAISRNHRDLCKIPCLDPLYLELCQIIRNVIRDVETSDTTSNDSNSISDVQSLVSHATHGAFDLQNYLKPGHDPDPTPPPQGPDLPPDLPLPVVQDDVEALTSFDQAKNDPRLPCFSVRMHKSNPGFFKRAGVFEKIDKVLLPANTASDTRPSHLQAFAICGMGGVGKTQTAVEYAYSRRDKFEAVFWVSADDKNILTEQFAQIAVSLGLVEQSMTKDLPETCSLVKGWLSNPVRSYEVDKQSPNNIVPWLLVFDNVDNITVLRDLWPEEGLGSVLVTSRDAMVKHRSQGIHALNKGVDLRPFDTKEAVTFIKGLTPQQYSQANRCEDEYIERIANILGGLPLLITKLPGARDRLGLFSYKELCGLFEDGGIELINQDQDDRDQTEILSVFAQIGLKGLSIESLGLLGMISILDPDRIPETVLLGACGEGIDGFPNSKEGYYKARKQLLQASLIERDAVTDELSLHRIVQAVTRSNMSQPRLLEILERAVQAVSNIWPFGKLVERFDTNRYQGCADIFPSVIRLKVVQETVFAKEKQKCNDPDTGARLLNDAGWYWFERGYPDEAKEFWKLTECLYSQAADDVPTEHRSSLLRRANLNHATASLETNDRKDALERYKRWLDSAPSVDGAEAQYELACIYNETGVACAMNEMYDEAIDYFQQSIDSFYALEDYEDTMLDWPVPNLGFMYWVQGRYDDAEKVLHEILDIMEENYGVDDIRSFKTGKILYALGNVYTSLGQFDDGLRYHTRCLKQYRATLGDNHHRVGDISYRLADHYIRRRNFDEAKTMINHAIKIFSTKKHCKNEYARAIYKLGQMHEAMGEETEALRRFQEAFDLRRKLVPRDGRKLEDLTEEDYDKLVIFWSR